MTAYNVGFNGFDAHATIAIPAMGAVWLAFDPTDEVETAVGGAAG